MTFKAIPVIAMVVLMACAACGAKAFPVGFYEPAQPAPTDRITEFSFAADGTFVSAYYDGKAASGTYVVAGDKITLTELNADSPCLGAPATMNWETSGNVLTLKFYEDLCREGPSYDWAREWIKGP